MKKSIILLLILCMFGLTSCSPAKEKLFESEYLKYSFKYPATWKIGWHKVIKEIEGEGISFNTSSGDMNSFTVIDFSKDTKLFPSGFSEELENFLKKYNHAVIISDKPNVITIFFKNYFVAFSYNSMHVFEGMQKGDKDIMNKYSVKKDSALKIIKSFTFNNGDLKDVEVIEGDETTKYYIETIIKSIHYTRGLYK